jgi:hypothetical protein
MSRRSAITNAAACCPFRLSRPAPRRKAESGVTTRRFCARARELADARIAAIEKTIAELDAARRALMGLSRQCAAADTLHCPIIAAFEQV